MRYMVWDWNGTLLDDVSLCVEIMDRMLKKRGLPPLGSAGRYRRLFTFPVKEYYRAAGWDFDREPFEALAAEYIAEYNRLALGCGLFPEARAVLETLKRAGWRQVIASASDQAALEEQVRAQGIAGYFDALLGVSGFLGSGKEGVAKAYFAEKHMPPSRLTFIGDTVHDWQVAESMSAGCILVAGGHQSRERLAATGAPVADALGQVPELLR